MNAFHPDSKFTCIPFCKAQKQLDTEQKAPKSLRNSHPTPPNLVGTQRLLKNTSFHYSSVDTTRGSKSTCCKHKATKTLPNSFGWIRTQSDEDENTKNRFRNPQRPKQKWKTDPEKAQSTKFRLQKARCTASTSPQRSTTDEKARKCTRWPNSPS